MYGSLIRNYAGPGRFYKAFIESKYVNEMDIPDMIVIYDFSIQ